MEILHLLPIEQQEPEGLDNGVLAEGTEAIQTLAESEARRLYGKPFAQVCAELDQQAIDSGTSAAREMGRYRFLLGPA